MSKIAEALARALAGVVTKTEDLWRTVSQQYENTLDTLVDTSRRVLRITIVPALMAIWLGGLTTVPPVLIALIYATVILIIWAFSVDRYMREIWNIQIGDWTVRALVQALKGAGASWPAAVREAVISIRLAVRNVFATGLIPVLAALWIFAADPYHQWEALLGVTIAALFGILGFLTPSERGGRRLLLFVAFALLVGSAWLSANNNPDSRYNQYLRNREAAAVAEEMVNAIPPCAENPQVVPIANSNPGVSEYRIGPIGLYGKCQTGVIKIPDTGWVGAKVTVEDAVSYAKIQYVGGPPSTLQCQGPKNEVGVYPNFRVTDGYGYITVLTWDQGVEEPSHRCDPL